MWHTNILCVGSETAGDELLWWGGYSGISYLKWIVFIGHLTFKKLPHSRFFFPFLLKPVHYEWLLGLFSISALPWSHPVAFLHSYLSCWPASEWLCRGHLPFEHNPRNTLDVIFLSDRSEVSELHHWQTPTQPLMLNTDSNDTHDCVS